MRCDRDSAVVVGSSQNRGLSLGLKGEKEQGEFMRFIYMDSRRKSKHASISSTAATIKWNINARMTKGRLAYDLTRGIQNSHTVMALEIKMDGWRRLIIRL